MASFNKIIIVGYLGRDPEIRYMPDGSAVCNFSVATTERKKDIAGEPREITTWFRVNAWGRTAEACNQCLAKGNHVFVEGRLRLHEYTDRDGGARSSLEVTANEVQFLSKSESYDDADSNDGRPKAKASSTVSGNARKITSEESRAAMIAQGATEDKVPF